MKRDITAIRGIGLATAEIFKKNGFESVEDLASASVLDIMAIPGFREARATQVIASARELMAEGGEDTPVQKSEEGPQKAKEKSGKKKKSKSKEKKKNGKKKKSKETIKKSDKKKAKPKSKKKKKPKSKKSGKSKK